uniref:Ubiquitin-like protein ATG12 n=1 Tax=Heterorhabditis bacteriophora TaxID=37862 RepID=A0A1I7X7K3_HETBA
MQRKFTSIADKDVKTVKGLDWLYLQYCLVTGIYMLEPWEHIMTDKVTVLLRAVGDAPSLKQKKYTIDSTKTVAWFTQVIRKMIQLPDDEISGSDGKDNHLVMHYSTTHAWG